jgi:hypothetical protein
MLMPSFPRYLYACAPNRNYYPTFCTTTPLNITYFFHLRLTSPSAGLAAISLLQAETSFVGSSFVSCSGLIVDGGVRAHAGLEGRSDVREGDNYSHLFPLSPSSMR